jgi:hypothetical protein
MRPAPSLTLMEQQPAICWHLASGRITAHEMPAAGDRGWHRQKMGRGASRQAPSRHPRGSQQGLRSA